MRSTPKVPEAQRMAVLVFAVEDTPDNEIATEQVIPAGTVRSRQRSARRTLLGVCVRHRACRYFGIANVVVGVSGCASGTAENSAGAGSGAGAGVGVSASAGMSAGGSSGVSGNTGAGGSATSGGETSGGAASGGAPFGGTTAIGGSGGAVAVPNLFATGSGVVEVFVNGERVGKSNGDAQLVSVAAALKSGNDNVIAIRATKGSGTVPYIQAQVSGAFGTAGTSARWRVKPVSTNDDEKTGSNWAATAFDDSAWAAATDAKALPTAKELTSGSALGIWTNAAGDAAALFRMKLYVPDGWTAAKPYGYGSSVTGGAGGAVVTVSTAKDFAAAVSGNTAKIVQVMGTIDFTGSEGTTTSSACYQSQCQNGQYEYITNGLGACTSANKPTFDVTYDKAGTTPLAVGSNKTIVGVGPRATIKGKGLALTNGVSNVIVQNLTLTQINPQIVWGGDAITIDNAKDVWIDHNRISLVGRQFIVTGFGQAANVTISYNELDGRTQYSSTCNGAHYWTLLFLGASDTITALGNWIHHTAGRGPHAGGYDSVNVTAHFVNNYYETVPGHAADADVKSNLVYEGTAFDNVTTPFTSGYHGSAYAPVASNLGATSSACMSALGRVCVANSVSSQSTLPLDIGAITALGAHPESPLHPYPAAEVPFIVPHLAGPGRL